MINSIFEEKKSFIYYCIAEAPSVEDSLKRAVSLKQSGVYSLEVSFPFSYAVVYSVTISVPHKKALNDGVTLLSPSSINSNDLLLPYI